MKRIAVILAFVIVGMILIEISIQNKKETNYLEMNYKIIYTENNENTKKLLAETEYFDYYFSHYDENAYIEFADGKKANIIEAYQNNEVLLGDLMKNIAITKVPNFNLKLNENKEQKLARKYKNNELSIYYYKINDIQVENKKTKEQKNLLELIDEEKISINDILYYLEENKDILKIEKENYIIYQNTDFKVIVDTTTGNYYFGNSNLTEDILKSA